MFLIIISLCFVCSTVGRHVIFQKDGPLHPRTFYLTDEQENDVIKKAVCEDLDCPAFTVQKDHPYFIQQRLYREARFLTSSDQEKCNFTGTLNLAMEKIVAYRKGENTREKAFPRTQPILVQIDQYMTMKSSNPWCHLTFNVGYYMPHYWGIPAAPLQRSLNFRNINENFSVFVHTFTGSIESVLLKEIGVFRKNLEELQLCYKSMRFYLALYDMPNLKQHSRHEIWLEKC